MVLGTRYSALGVKNLLARTGESSVISWEKLLIGGIVFRQNRLIPKEALISLPVRFERHYWRYVVPMISVNRS